MHGPLPEVISVNSVHNFCRPFMVGHHCYSSGSLHCQCIIGPHSEPCANALGNSEKSMTRPLLLSVTRLRGGGSDLDLRYKKALLLSVTRLRWGGGGGGYLDL